NESPKRAIRPAVEKAISKTIIGIGISHAVGPLSAIPRVHIGRTKPTGSKLTLAGRTRTENKTGGHVGCSLGKRRTEGHGNTQLGSQRRYRRKQPALGNGTMARRVREMVGACCGLGWRRSTSVPYVTSGRIALPCNRQISYHSRGRRCHPHRHGFHAVCVFQKREPVYTIHPPGCTDHSHRRPIGAPMAKPTRTPCGRTVVERYAAERNPRS